MIVSTPLRSGRDERIAVMPVQADIQDQPTLFSQNQGATPGGVGVLGVHFEKRKKYLTR